jgi:hypothetical protein
LALKGIGRVLPLDPSSGADLCGPSPPSSNAIPPTDGDPTLDAEFIGIQTVAIA